MREAIEFRRGTPTDSYAVFEVFEQSLADLSRRMGSTAPTSAAEPAKLASMWEERRSLYEHLARSAEQFWLAEWEGQVIGFSRSTLRDGVRELTELFVLPGQQSAGVGRELLVRAFPANGARYRSIVASADVRAQALYLKAGVYPRTPIYYFWRAPRAVKVESDLAFEPVTSSAETLAAMGLLDQALLGFRRDEDHAWLTDDRQGYLYTQGGRPVGYGYVGVRSGPFALLEAGDYPAVLAHAEREASAQGHDEFGLEVPMVNRVVVDHLLAQGYRMDTFLALLMSDAPFGRFENYVLTSPPFFL